MRHIAPLGNDYGDKFEPWMIDKALELFSHGESITSVCCELDICRETYYQWRDDRSHPFSATARKGEQLSQQNWERLGRRGVEGGVDKFAGSSYQFIMRNRFRDDYTDTTEKKQEPSAVEQILLAALTNKK